MFRITRIQNAPTTTLKIEGRLLKPWVHEFKTAMQNASAAAPVTLDLSGLTFIDMDGLEVLAVMIRDGVLVCGCSNFVAELLQTVKL